jgi:hypothetical protein
MEFHHGILLVSSGEQSCLISHSLRACAMSAQPPKRTTARRRLDFSRKRSAATAALGVAPVAASAAGSAVASAASSSADVGAASSSAPPAKRQHLESDEKQQPAVTETPLEKWQKKVCLRLNIACLCDSALTT